LVNSQKFHMSTLTVLISDIASDGYEGGAAEEKEEKKETDNDVILR